MNNLIKKWWFWLIVLASIIIISSIIFVAKSDKGVGENGISKQEFEKIELGMSESSVTKIISPNDLEAVEKELEKSKENSIYTYKYKYYGEKRGYVIITYEADYSNGDLFVLPKVTKKEKFNLK